MVSREDHSNLNETKQSIGGVVPLQPARLRRGDTSSHTRTRTRTHALATRTRTWAAGQSKTLEGWCPCGLRARDVEIRVEMCITSVNPDYTLH